MSDSGIKDELIAQEVRRLLRACGGDVTLAYQALYDGGTGVVTDEWLHSHEVGEEGKGYTHSHMFDDAGHNHDNDAGFDQQGLAVDAGPSRQEMLREELSAWWRAQAENEIERTIPKAVEYGSADLQVMAQAMVRLLPEGARSQKLGMEMALAFYALGKVARLFGAFEEGREPSEDTWFDLGVYCRMAERVRQTGRWV